MGNLARGRAATDYLDFNCRHSIPDSSATEQGWFVTAANRTSDIHQLVVTQSAANYQWFPFLMDDVFIAEGEFPTQRSSLTPAMQKDNQNSFSSEVIDKLQ